MANNTKTNLERVEKILQPKKRSTGVQGTPMAAPVGEYQKNIIGASEGGEAVASARSYNTATPGTSSAPAVASPSPAGNANGEVPVTAPSYNSGFKTYTVMTYTDYINSQEQSVIDKYNSDVDYAGKKKDQAYEKADDRLNIAMRDAQANFQKNDPRYGAQAENLLAQGLGNSGYGEYLAGKRVEQLSDERMAARSQYNYATMAADEEYDDSIYAAEQNKFAGQQTLDEKRANYQLQLDAEFKAAYNEIIASVNAGTYSAELGEKILSQYAGGSLSTDIVRALKSAEAKANLSNEKAAATAITEWLAGLGVAPTEEQFRYTLSQMGLPETAINNYVAAAFKDGKFVGDLTASGNSSGNTGGSSSGSTTIKPTNPGDQTDVINPGGYPEGYDAYVTEESLLEQFKKIFGREPTEEEWNYAKTKMQKTEGGWYFNSKNDFYDIFGITRPNSNVGNKKVYSSSEIIDKAVDILNGVDKREVDGHNTLTSLTDYIGNYILSTKTDADDITEDEQKTHDALCSMADGLIISSFDFNLDGSKIKYDKVGDNFSIVGPDGTKYRVENGGKADLGNISAEDSAAIRGLVDGVVFGYKGELYVKASDGAYLLRARPTFMPGSYGNLWKAVYTEAIKDVLTKGVTNNSAGIEKNKNNIGEMIVGGITAPFAAAGEAIAGVGDYFKNLFGNESTELDSSLGDKVIVSSARYNVLGSKIRADKVGDNFSINMGDKTYRVENEGIVNDEAILNALNSTAGVYDGDVIAYGGEIYLKGDKTWYKLGARDVFMKGSFDKLKEAIYEEANSDLQNTNHGAGLDISDMGRYEKGLSDYSEEAATDAASGRGYAWASKINPGATDGEGWITVNVNGEQCRVKLNGEVSDIDAAGANEREVFLKDGEAYLKMGGKVYNVDKRFLGGGSYNKMVQAIAENIGDQVGSKYAGNAVDLYAYSKTKVSNLKYDSQVKVELGGGIYKFDVDAVLGSDSDAYKAAGNAGIASGGVFAHGEDIYVMGDGECYKLGARDVFNNRDYNDFKAAVAGAVQNKTFEDFTDDNGYTTQTEGLHAVTSGKLVYSPNASINQALIYNNKEVELLELDPEREEGSVKEAILKLSAEGISDGLYTYKGNLYVKHRGKAYIVPNKRLNHDIWKAAFESTENQRELPFGNLWGSSGSSGSSGTGNNSSIGGGTGGNSGGTAEDENNGGDINESPGNSLPGDSHETPPEKEPEKESGWDKITNWFETTFGNKENEEEYVNEDLDVTRGLASFETDGRLFGIDRGLKEGDNFTVEIDGKSYAVESGGLVDGSKATHLYEDAAEVANGEVFLYGDGMYLKKDDKIYEVDARKLFGKGQAEKLREAIKSNSVDGEGGSDSVYNSAEVKANISAIDFKSGKYNAFDKITLQDKLGKEYKLQVRAVLGTDSAAYRAAVAEGNNIADGQLFRHGQDFYIKDGDTVLKMSATGGAKNGDYDKLVSLDNDKLNEELKTRSHNAKVKLGLFKDTVTMFTESGEYTAKKEQNVSNVERVKEIAKDIATQNVFAIGDRLYYKATERKIWLLEDNPEMLSAIQNGINPFELGNEIAGSGIPTYTDMEKMVTINGFTKNYELKIKELNELEPGKIIGIVLDGERHALKCGYRSTDGIHAMATEQGIEEGELFACGGFLYVYFSEGSLLLIPANDTTIVNNEYQDSKYRELAAKVEEKAQGKETSYSKNLGVNSAMIDKAHGSYNKVEYPFGNYSNYINE